MKNRLVSTARLVITAVVATSILAVPVSAHHSPSGCNVNHLVMSVDKSVTQVSPGDSITYTVSAANTNEVASCDFTGVRIEIKLPAADGTPTGTMVTLVSGATYPSGTPNAVVGSATYVVAVNPGVTDIVAKASAAGVLHDAPVDHNAQISKTIGTTVVNNPATPPVGGGGTGTPPGGNTGGANTGGVGGSGVLAARDVLAAGDTAGLPATGGGPFDFPGSKYFGL